MAEDYYKTLGVSRNASPSEIQKAYRDLARKYHPDLNPDDKTAKKRFQEVQSAFDVLNDPKKREMYDRYGSAFESAAGAAQHEGPTFRWSRGEGGAEDLDFSDLFGGQVGGDAGGFAELLRQFRRGGATGEPAAASSRDIHAELTVPFATAIGGGKAGIVVRRATGRSETIDVKIPAGIDEGQKIRLRGQGMPAARGGRAGDLIVTVHVAPHPHYRRHGKDLEVRVPVTLAEAAIGAKVDVPAPRGTIRVTVPPGTSSGTRLRIKGQGVASPGQDPGDLYAEILLVLPDGLDMQDRRLLEELLAKHPHDPRSQLKW